MAAACRALLLLELSFSSLSLLFHDCNWNLDNGRRAGKLLACVDVLVIPGRSMLEAVVNNLAASRISEGRKTTGSK